MQKFSFLWGWVTFLSKKKTFFSCKTSVFAGLGALFGTFFCHFSCKISVFCEAGRSFWVKKKHIFSCKTKVFAGLGALFDTFFCDFCVIFLKCANPARRSARSARGLTRDAKAVSGKPEGTILVRPASFAPHCRPPTPLVVKVKWSEWSEVKWVIHFWVLYFYQGRDVYGNFEKWNRGCFSDGKRSKSKHVSSQTYQNRHPLYHM